MRKNYSKQREQIKEVIIGNRNHPTAEEVHELVRKKKSTASLSTVYRNLNELVAEGVIASITLPNGTKHYDGNVDQHGHAVCSVCGKVIDLELTDDEAKKNLFGFEGFVTTGYYILLDGYCVDCAKKEDINIS